FMGQWYLRNTGQSNGLAGADVNAVAAWAHTTGEPSIVIALLDDGFDLTHPDLIANIATNATEAQFGTDGQDNDLDGDVDNMRGWDFYDNDNDPSPNTAANNHGTAVAGMAVARGNNAVGLAGIAQRCRFLPLRVGSDDGNGGFQINGAGLLNAIYHAAGRSTSGFQTTGGADIISMSLEIVQQQAYDDAFA